MTTISEAEIRITEDILIRTGEMLAQLTPDQAKDRVMENGEWRGEDGEWIASSTLPFPFSIYGAHQLGLMAGGQFQDALSEGADVLTGSTGKTLSGPQGGLILWNDPALTGRLCWAIFPGMAATHQINRVAALAVSLAEMLAFGQAYMAQIVANSQRLAAALHARGFNVLGAHKGYTQTHQVAVHVGEHGGGYAVAERLARANIIVNKNLMPTDTPENHVLSLSKDGIDRAASAWAPPR